MEKELIEEIGAIEKEILLFHEDDSENLAAMARELVPSLIVSAYKIWKILGKPKGIKYPVHSEKGRIAHKNEIIRARKTYLASVSDLFGHMDL